MGISILVKLMKRLEFCQIMFQNWKKKKDQPAFFKDNVLSDPKFNEKVSAHITFYNINFNW
jgi:hypothetical protein